MLKLKFIVGSTRPTRFSEALVPWAADAARGTGAFDVEVLDLKDHPMPFYDQPVSPASVKDGAYGNPAVRSWAKKIAEADAFLVITPEYNHGYSAVLKNALDSVYAEWNNKPIGFVAYGSVGGARAVEQLRTVATELQMAPVRAAVHIMEPWNLRDEGGKLKAGALDAYARPLATTLEQLARWGKSLKTARGQ